MNKPSGFARIRHLSLCCRYPRNAGQRQIPINESIRVCGLGLTVREGPNSRVKISQALRLARFSAKPSLPSTLKSNSAVLAAPSRLHHGLTSLRLTSETAARFPRRGVTPAFRKSSRMSVGSPARYCKFLVTNPIGNASARCHEKVTILGRQFSEIAARLQS